MRSKKKKFKPVITRVKLNPEQAVLTCNCYSDGYLPGSFDRGTDFVMVCGGGKGGFTFSGNEIGFSTGLS
jgi:hypothetical protein